MELAKRLPPLARTTPFLGRQDPVLQVDQGRV